MSANRKADLQRRLTAPPAPQPPADLARRIKADIPDLGGARSPQPGWRASAQMKIAASILIVIGVSWASVRFLRQPAVATAPPTAIVRPADTSGTVIPERSGTANLSERNTAELPSPPPLSLQPSIVEPQTPAPRVAAAPAREAVAQEAENTSHDTETAAALRKDTADSAAGSALNDRDANRASAKAETIVEPVAGSNAPAAAPAPAAGALAMERKTAPNPRREAEQRLTVINETPPFAGSRALFGVTDGAAEFERVRVAIARGERPGHVDAAALVNYFAAIASTSREPLSLDAEVSPRVASDATAASLRVSLDSATGDPAAAVARDARLEISFDKSTVTEAHRIGGSDHGTEFSEAEIRHGSSTTQLYDLAIARKTRRDAVVAAITLRYRDAVTGEERTSTRTVDAGGSRHSWSEASRRQRLATLAATFAAALEGQGRSRAGIDELARQAEELASERPGDARGRALADLVSAFARLRSSAPTGSGR